MAVRQQHTKVRQWEGIASGVRMRVARDGAHHRSTANRGGAQQRLMGQRENVDGADTERRPPSLGKRRMPWLYGACHKNEWIWANGVRNERETHHLGEDPISGQGRRRHAPSADTIIIEFRASRSMSGMLGRSKGVKEYTPFREASYSTWTPGRSRRRMGRALRYFDREEGVGRARCASLFLCGQTEGREEAPGIKRGDSLIQR
ncbi:hypothetical protein R3P38DRAFT_2808168 [Favolaschia claudopus]|uniref:Uncharacterized protein n=1 Tax=Favolaschia claudopus TaxID=2862362 RepID=A0AAV9ZI11_9AGAR